MSIDIVSRDRIHSSFPGHLSGETRRTVVPLSILDGTVARFAPTSAVWFYDQSSSPDGNTALSSDRLVRSLRTTLAAYPQWAGQLEFAPYSVNTSGGHTQRFGRLQIIYGDSSVDPGVELVIARCPSTLESLVPSQEERNEMGAWNAGIIGKIALLPTSPRLALADMITSEGLPSVIIQITTFSCGGVALAIKIAHPLADATALLQFTRDWANINKKAVTGSPSHIPTPLFDPAALDRAAAGDIDAPELDLGIVEQAQRLPFHRYDWWASSGPSCPPFMIDGTVVPPLLETAFQASEKGTSLPWTEWKYTETVEHHVVYFSPEELQGMWENSSKTVRLSKLDALLAHIWGLIVSARGQATDATPVHLDTTIGVRGRLSPPLPESTLGSPLVIVPVTLPAREVASCSELAASSLRSAIALCDAPSLAAHLHDAAFYLSPQRYWNAFLGERHTLVTSWVRLGVYEVDFGGGQAPRYVEAIMPGCDGCVCVMEVSAGEASTKGTEKKWYDSGVAVSLHLRAEVAQRVLGDPILRRFE